MISSYSTTSPYIKVGLPHPLKTLLSSCLLLSVIPAQCPNIVEKVEILYLFILLLSLQKCLFSHILHNNGLCVFVCEYVLSLSILSNAFNMKGFLMLSVSYKICRDIHMTFHLRFISMMD